MKGDFTRNTFDPTKHYSQVLMQQGRVQLDSAATALQDFVDTYPGTALALALDVTADTVL